MNRVTVVSNVFEIPADFLINPVNTVGVMGAGLALACATRYPDILAPYKAHCASQQFHPGEVFLIDRTKLISAPMSSQPNETGDLIEPRWIACVATKQHWKAPSQLEWIQQSVEALDRLIMEVQPQRIALPAIGCGKGGLAWDSVAPLLRDLVRRHPTRQWIVAPGQQQTLAPSPRTRR